MSAIYFRAEVLPDILKVNISEEQLISFTLIFKEVHSLKSLSILLSSRLSTIHIIFLLSETTIGSEYFT